MACHPLRAIISAGTLAVSLLMLSGTAMAETYRIDGQVWGWYQQYLRNIGNGNKPGAFAISKDGKSAFYSWCQDIRCVAGPTYSQDALNACERRYETECVVFAVRDDIKVEYEIVASTEEPSAPPQLAPATVTTIAVSPEVLAEIDIYLRNAQRPGLVWSLAIAKDGTMVETGSCQILGGYAGSGLCNHQQGAMQGQVNRLTLKRCGGADECLVLYAGERKMSNIELVAN